MSKHLTYLIGEPGVGKSTLLGTLTAGSEYEEVRDPFWLRRHANGVTELGRHREDFSGTDALPMSVQPAVQQYLEAVGPALVLGEGDRLGNDTFFAYARRAGYELHLYVLVGTATAASRRKARGTGQNETWVKGRQTKVMNLIDRFRPEVLDASMDPGLLVRLMDDPVSRAFRP